MSETKTSWYFIVNPRAGSGKTMSEWVPAERLLEAEGIPFVTAMTDHKKHAITLAREAAAEGYRRIAAVGGDGSLHEVLGGICSWCEETGTPPEDFYLAVIPIGSGNDWIKSCHVPDNVKEALALLMDGSFGWMDIIRGVSDGGKVHYMANCAGIGFDSHVCDMVNHQKERGMRGKMIYLNALRYTIFHLKPISVLVREDGENVFSGEIFSLAAGNGPYSGGGMRQVPLAVNDDGMLDYMIVPKARLGSLVKEIPRLFAGTTHESSIIRSGHCQTLEIAPLNEASADLIEYDGELEGRLPLILEVSAHRIHVLKGKTKEKD
ncbi:Diacylglycerol kinase catalytic domain-containing protein [Bacteroidales bacterium WCE2004]|jgi:YegS/Rv2252/BmrU family lipid kinase|nr:diacylglycerol kinase family lipid kinase [Bacteroidales bacterium]SKC48431.1 Diacylglycerol kinase catalytic domain-containing protein [Bacteroidales bacterium WCE2004]